MPRFHKTVTHRPARDGTVTTSTHVPFFLALEVMSEAWAEHLVKASDGLLQPRDVGVVNVDANFRRELFVGYIDIDIEVVDVGDSSVACSFTIWQAQQQAASGLLTVARTDQGRTRSLVLTAEQQQALKAALQT